MHHESTKAVTTKPNIVTIIVANTSIATKVSKSEGLFPSFEAEHTVYLQMLQSMLESCLFSLSGIAKTFLRGRTKTT